MNPLLEQRTDEGIAITVYSTGYKKKTWALRITSNDGITFDFTLFDPDQWNMAPYSVRFVNVLGEDIAQLCQSKTEEDTLVQKSEHDSVLTLIANHRSLSQQQRPHVLVAKIEMALFDTVTIELNKAIFA